MTDARYDEAATSIPEAARETREDRSAAVRALRNLEAAEARLERDRQRVLDETRAKLVTEILPVLDNLDRTIAAAKDASDPALLEGVQMVRDQLAAIMTRFGLTRIDAETAEFDPALHEAIGVVPVRDPRYHRLVVSQAEPGYRFGDQLLRPAKVYVGKLTQPEPRYPRSF